MRKLILVDDEPLFLQYLEKDVDWQKYRFEVAGAFSNGLDALYYLNDNIIDALFTDIRMPLIDGNELIEKALEIQNNLYIVALSGYDDFPLVKGAFLNGAKDYLLKIDINTSNFEKMMHRMLKFFIALEKNHPTSSPIIKAQSSQIELIKEYILQNFNQELQLADLAVKFNFSPGYLSSLFTHETNMTFIEYLTLLRIEKAKQKLIDTDKPISQISNEVGYNNIEHFSRTFKKITGFPPSRYRKKHKPKRG